MRSTKQGFTLVELMVVLGMIGMIMAALTSSVMGAQKRAQIAKAESEVKVITQAILSYENYKHDLPPLTNRDADANSLGFLLGDGGSSEMGGKIPVLLMGQLKSGGKMMDPWNMPYRVTIRPSGASVKLKNAAGTMQTGFYLPNFYRLSQEERQ